MINANLWIHKNSWINHVNIIVLPANSCMTFCCPILFLFIEYNVGNDILYWSKKYHATKKIYVQYNTSTFDMIINYEVIIRCVVCFLFNFFLSFLLIIIIVFNYSHPYSYGCVSYLTWHVRYAMFGIWVIKSLSVLFEHEL